jgi:hypothetical protein
MFICMLLLSICAVALPDVPEWPGQYRNWLLCPGWRKGPFLDTQMSRNRVFDTFGELIIELMKNH